MFGQTLFFALLQLQSGFAVFFSGGWERDLSRGEVCGHGWRGQRLLEVNSTPVLLYELEVISDNTICFGGQEERGRCPSFAKREVGGRDFLQAGKTGKAHRLKG